MSKSAFGSIIIRYTRTTLFGVFEAPTNNSAAFPVRTGFAAESAWKDILFGEEGPGKADASRNGFRDTGL